MIRAPWLLMALTACAGSEPHSGRWTGPIGEADDTGDDDTAAWLVYDDEAPGAAPSDVEAAISASFLVLLSIDPAWLHQTYDALLGYGDGACPSYYLHDYTWWTDTCVVESGEGAGSSFGGSAITYWDTDVTESGVLYTNMAAFVAVDVQIQDPEGHELRAVASSTVWREGTRLEDGLELYEASFDGSFHWDGPVSGLAEGAQSWLAWENLLLDLGLSFQRDSGSGSTLISVDGALSGLPLDASDVFGLDSVLYDAVVLDATPDSTCTREPSGTIGVRGADGSWSYAAFDEDCDGCGALFQGGVLTGEVCPDFGALADWSDRPWEEPT